MHTDPTNLIVVALGGNALGNDVPEMHEKVEKTALQIAKLASTGAKIVICHGNGPQVGMIKNAFVTASNIDKTISDIPFPECGAMSQGYIGYCLVQGIKNALSKLTVKREVVGIISQTLVNESDSAFQNPTKPIGGFLTKDEADKISKETGNTYKEDAGRGYRQVVASPAPINIAEMNAIKELVEKGVIVVAGGGGGVPVLKKGDDIVGVPAVIDKDKTASLIASELNADKFVILTAVSKVAINYNTPNQKNLNKISVTEIKEYCKQGQFAPGSMLPKVEACIDFLKINPNGEALIASLDEADRAIEGKAGTVITA